MSAYYARVTVCTRVTQFKLIVNGSELSLAFSLPSNEDEAISKCIKICRNVGLFLGFVLLKVNMIIPLM